MPGWTKFPSGTLEQSIPIYLITDIFLPELPEVCVFYICKKNHPNSNSFVSALQHK